MSKNICKKTNFSRFFVVGLVLSGISYGQGVESGQPVVKRTLKRTCRKSSYDSSKSMEERNRHNTDHATLHGRVFKLKHHGDSQDPIDRKMTIESIQTAIDIEGNLIKMTSIKERKDLHEKYPLYRTILNTYRHINNLLESLNKEVPRNIQEVKKSHLIEIAQQNGVQNNSLPLMDQERIILGNNAQYIQTEFNHTKKLPDFDIPLKQAAINSHMGKYRQVSFEPSKLFEIFSHAMEDAALLEAQSFQDYAPLFLYFEHLKTTGLHTETIKALEEIIFPRVFKNLKQMPAAFKYTYTWKEVKKDAQKFNELLEMLDHIREFENFSLQVAQTLKACDGFQEASCALAPSSPSFPQDSVRLDLSAYNPQESTPWLTQWASSIHSGMLKVAGFPPFLWRSIQEIPSVLPSLSAVPSLTSDTMLQPVFYAESFINHTMSFGHAVFNNPMTLPISCFLAGGVTTYFVIQNHKPIRQKVLKTFAPVKKCLKKCKKTLTGKTHQEMSVGPLFEQMPDQDKVQAENSGISGHFAKMMRWAKGGFSSCASHFSSCLSRLSDWWSHSPKGCLFLDTPPHEHEDQNRNLDPHLGPTFWSYTKKTTLQIEIEGTADDQGQEHLLSFQ